MNTKKRLKVLIICSGNFPGSSEKNFPIYRAFVADQIKALRNLTDDIDISLYLIKGKGFKGYLKNLKPLKKYIRENNIDILHAHSGESGMLASFITTKPLIVTYHGDDINSRRENLLSNFPIIRSQWNIFVSQKLYEKSRIKIPGKKSIIPCGVDFEIFFPADKTLARKKLNINKEEKMVLFASAFDIPVKNYQLAKMAVDSLKNNMRLYEIKNRTRDEVALLLNAADVLLLSSLSEGSPQIIKEAMACNCPIVATNVGDINELIADTKGCYITSFDYNDVADKLKKALAFGRRTNGNEKIQHLNNKKIASTIFELYKKIFNAFYSYEYSN